MYKEVIFDDSDGDLEDQGSSQTQALKQIKANALHNLKRQYSLVQNQSTRTLFSETLSSDINLKLNIVEKTDQKIFESLYCFEGDINILIKGLYRGIGIKLIGKQP